MQIINIQNNGQKVIVAYPPEFLDILKRFFSAAQQRNEQLKLLLDELQKNEDVSNTRILHHLSHHWEDAEVDIELVKKLLP